MASEPAGGARRACSSSGWPRRPPATAGAGQRTRGCAARSRMRSAARTGSARGAGKALHGREDTERAFLALCIASPEEGEQALAGLDVDEHFSSELLRRAARHLRAGDLREPMAQSGGGSLDGDAELKALLAELVVESRARLGGHPAMLEAQRLQLELARVDRQIQQARGQQSGDVSELAQAQGDGQAASSTARTRGCWRRPGTGSRRGSGGALGAGRALRLKRCGQCGAWIARA